MHIELAAHAPKTRRMVGFAGLCALYASLHFDRQIIGILADSVKHDLRLSDQQLGMLTGSAFSIVFALLGLYFGTIADFRNPLVLARTGALLWSAASIGAGLSSNYAMLIASRACIALGEAIAAAATVSLMSQLAGERLRASAFSVFASTAMAGAGAAAIIGGRVLEMPESWTGFAGWRVALFVAAIPGLLVCLLLSVFRWQHSARAPGVPIRGRVLAVLIAAALAAVLLQIYLPPSQAVPIAVALAALAAAAWLGQLPAAGAAPSTRLPLKGPFCWLLVSMAAVLFLDSAASFWLIPFAQRRFALNPASAGAELGGLLVVGGILGCLCAGAWADRWQRSSRSGRMRTLLLLVAAEGIFVLLALAQSTHSRFLIAFGLFCLASGGWTGVVTAVAMDMVPVAARGTGSAIYFLTTTLLGPALGAFVVGTISDAAGSLRVGIASSCAVLLIALPGLARLIYAPADPASET